MTKTRSQQTRPYVAASGRPALCLDEIEAWILDVSPTVRAYGTRGRAPSMAQQRWMTEQHEFALLALTLLEDEAFEAEATGRECDALQWLHTRVSALLSATQAVVARRAAA